MLGVMGENFTEVCARATNGVQARALRRRWGGLCLVTVLGLTTVASCARDNSAGDGDTDAENEGGTTSGSDTTTGGTGGRGSSGGRSGNGDGDGDGDGDGIGGAAPGGATGSGGGSGGGSLGQGGMWGTDTECNDGIDNDGDGLTDYAFDPGCFGPQDGTETSGSRAEESGFTTFDFGDESRVVYVSEEGDDQNDGSTPELAVQTLTHAAELVRDGEHDFILLKRGDTFRNQTLGRFKSGKDAAHPLVIGSYGESLELPRVEVVDRFIDHNGKGRSFVALIDLHLVASTRDPDDPDFDGAGEALLRYVGWGQNLLIEGCHIEFGEIVVQSFGDNPDTAEPDDGHYENVEIRANVIEKAYHRDTCSDAPEGDSTYRPSGIYSSHVHGLLLEGNLFDHNGWNEDVASACATIYNHNVYLNANDLVVLDNVFARASSMHMKLRSDATDDMIGTVIDGNYFVEGEIGISIGGNSDEPRRFVSSVIRENVMSDIGRSQPTTRTLGWGIEVQDNDDLLIESNYFLNSRTDAVGNTYAIQIADTPQKDVTIQENLFYRLRGRALFSRAASGQEGITVENNTFVDPDQDACLIEHVGAFAGYDYSSNEYFGSASEDEWFCGDGGGTLPAWKTNSGEDDATKIALPDYVDPDRDIESYTESLELGSTLDDYLAAARLRSRLDWSPELTAPAINEYIRAGFEE